MKAEEDRVVFSTFYSDSYQVKHGWRHREAARCSRSISRREKWCQVYSGDTGKKGRHCRREQGLGYRRWKQLGMWIDRGDRGTWWDRGVHHKSLPRMGSKMTPASLTLHMKLTAPLL